MTFTRMEVWCIARAGDITAGGRFPRKNSAEDHYVSKYIDTY